MMKNMPSFKKRIQTVEFKIIFMITIIMIPMIALLNFNSYYAQQIAKKQAMDSFSNVLKIYMTQIENSFAEVDKYIYKLDQNNQNFNIMKTERDMDKYMLGEIWLHNELAESITGFQYIDNLFVYNPNNGHFIYGGKKDMEPATKSGILTHIRLATKRLSSRQAGVWNYEQIGSGRYVFRIFKFDKLFVGAWVTENNLLADLGISNSDSNNNDSNGSGNDSNSNSNSISDNRIELVKTPMEQKEATMVEGRKYYIFDQISGGGGFGFAQYVSEKLILKQIPALNNTIKILSFLFILLLPVAVYAIRKIVVMPLKNLRTAMRKIENGDIGFRLETGKQSYEFERVHLTFNNMMDQIENLKIDVYEKKVKEKKIQLRNLQLQINPHFLLNTLNLLYSYDQKDYPHIQKMIIFLVKYFRYMYKANEDFVTLENELMHVENYLNIQRVRYPDSFVYEVRCGEELGESPIPPMLIQHFVENSIKYGMVLGEKSGLRIFVDIDKETLEGEDYLRIQIHDSGKGFSEESLVKIKAGRKYVDKNGEHIGIWNSLMRIDMLYEQKGKVDFFNAEDGGAVVSLLLPVNGIV